MNPQTPKQILYIVVITLAGLAFIGVSALSFSLFYKTYADPSILTALIAITSGLIGSLGSILTNTRQMPLATESTTTTTTTTTPDPKPPGGGPTPVTVEQPADNPIPVTTEQPQPEERKP
jgi:hypothetical protein